MQFTTRIKLLYWKLLSPPERGMHIMVDAYGCYGELMCDPTGIVNWLNNLPKKIGMRLLRPALAMGDKAPKCQLMDEGISGFCLLAESHISVHTWPMRGELQFDLYSCKPFSIDLVVKDLVEAFGAQETDVMITKRRRRPE